MEGNASLIEREASPLRNRNRKDKVADDEWMEGARRTARRDRSVRECESRCYDVVTRKPFYAVGAVAPWHRTIGPSGDTQRRIGL